MAKQGIIPIRRPCEPPEGRHALQYLVNIGPNGAAVDLSQVVMQGQMKSVQALFFDNAANDFNVYMVCEGTLQRIVMFPHSQGYINLLLPNNPKLIFTADSSPVDFQVSFLNFQTAETVWQGCCEMLPELLVSVGLEAPMQFSVTGSPVLPPGGTLGLEWNDQIANRIFAGPSAGPDGQPIFRALVAADIPALPYAPSTLPTQTILTAGTAATYNVPAGCRQLRIQIIGGGGGGAGTSNTVATGGTQGQTSSFDNASANVRALGGAPAGSVLGGYSPTNGGGVANRRCVGCAGTVGWNYGLTAGFTTGGVGGASSLASGPNGAINTGAGTAAPVNSGAGGSGASNIAGASFVAGGGGQGGETAWLIINNPAASYLYTIGDGGAGGASTQNGGKGGSGTIIIDEFY